jgi:4-diphosphocytidyl-2-C-methyl-D-erythritol kinase
MTINARAYAKINWLLEVGRLREDGYHELSTLFQTIDLYDELTFSLANDISLKIVDPNFSVNLPVDNKNLVIKAADLLAKELDKKQGVNMQSRF